MIWQQSGRELHLLEASCFAYGPLVNRRLASLRSLVQLARIMRLAPWHLEVRDTRGPGKQGFRALLQELDGNHTPKAMRDRCALRLLYDLALRCGGSRHWMSRTWTSTGRPWRSGAKAEHQDRS